MLRMSIFSALIFEQVSGLEQTRWATRGAKTLFVQPRIFLKVMSVILSRAWIVVSVDRHPFASQLGTYWMFETFFLVVLSVTLGDSNSIVDVV